MSTVLENAGRVIDTSRHWTGGSAIYTWRVRCCCCLTHVDGQGSKGKAGRTLRPMGWAYIRRATGVNFVDMSASPSGWARDVRGWVCQVCMTNRPELAEASDRPAVR